MTHGSKLEELGSEYIQACSLHRQAQLKSEAARKELASADIASAEAYSKVKTAEWRLLNFLNPAEANG